MLPDFAAFVLLQDATGRQALHDYYLPYLAIAREQGVGIVLDTPTWRANPDWATRLGYSARELDQANRQAVALLEDIRASQPPGGPPIVISGAIGPQGDGYRPVEVMSARDAERYHAAQIGSFSRTAADMVTAFTMTYADEAIGVVRAAQAVGMPAVIGFTVETDGRLPDGTRLRDAIEEVDAATSHAELDEAEDLDEGDPVQLGADHRELRRRLPRVRVLGGCCGTDHRHVTEVLTAWDA